MNIVVGTGPAGVSAAVALVRQGLPVTMLDVGLQLEAERLPIVERLASTDPTAWSSEDLRMVKQGVTSSSKGVPIKRLFGSDFPYQRVPDIFPLARGHHVDTAMSFARGGFSTVWGAAMAPYLPEDLANWPVSFHELEPHYRAVLGFMSTSARKDDLSDVFRIEPPSTGALEPSAQARALLDDLERARVPLTQLGFRFGSAWLAVRACTSSAGPGCNYCGLCMYGCPRRLIYNSEQTLDYLRSFANFTYRPDVIVRSVSESAGGAVVHGFDAGSASPIHVPGERIFLACGALSSTRILLESLSAFDRSVTMLDSQYYLLPMIRYRSTGSVEGERLHTLCQLFLELSDPVVSPRTVHLQIYTYNELYVDAFRHMLGPLYRPLLPALKQIISRMMIVQGYLHSDLSPQIALTLRKSNSDGPATLHAERIVGAVDPKNTVRRVIRKLRQARTYLRAIPVGTMLQMAPSGRGFHSGGTFPMRTEPAELESDRFGRPHGFKRIHVVDSSVFPSIPATTITFSVMANAHRIASEYSLV